MWLDVTEVRSESFRLVTEHCHCNGQAGYRALSLKQTSRPKRPCTSYVEMCFHRWVWYRVLSLRYVCIQSSGIILIPEATFVPNFVSFVTSVADLAHGEKLHTQWLTQSLTQLTWCAGNRSETLCDVAKGQSLTWQDHCKDRISMMNDQPTKHTMLLHQKREYTSFPPSLNCLSSPVGFQQWGYMDELPPPFLSFTHSAAFGTLLPLWCRSFVTLSIHLFLCLSWPLVPNTHVANAFEVICSYSSTLRATTIVVSISAYHTCVTVFSRRLMYKRYIPYH